MLATVILTNINPACIESALHGLGHALDGIRDHDSANEYRLIRENIVDRFLSDRPGLSTELRTYALAARTGMIL
jgi:hypothetical protein